MKKMTMVNNMHAKQWDEFLHLDAERRQQQLHHQGAPSGYGVKQQGFSHYDGSVVNQQYAGSNLAMGSRNLYSNPLGNYPSRPYNNFGDFHRQRHEDCGKAYNRY